MGSSVSKYYEIMSDREIIDAKYGKKDKFVQQVKDKFEERSQVGIKKYNTTLERDDLNFLDWLTHLQEELMDATLYVERLKTSYAEENTKNSTRSKRELYKTIPKEQ
tara:strand:- start:327 stop:647 length:321 start_codon:yes stop_codon:yes gene_type:complete